MYLYIYIHIYIYISVIMREPEKHYCKRAATTFACWQKGLEWTRCVRSRLLAACLVSRLIVFMCICIYIYIYIERERYMCIYTYAIIIITSILYDGSTSHYIIASYVIVTGSGGIFSPWINYSCVIIYASRVLLSMFHVLSWMCSCLSVSALVLRYTILYYTIA